MTYPLSDTALKRFVAAVRKHTDTHTRGLMTDAEFHAEIVHEIRRCEDTSELHYRLTHMDETREAAVAELAGLSVERVRELRDREWIEEDDEPGLPNPALVELFKRARRIETYPPRPLPW